MFKSLKLKKEDFTSIGDLAKLPILTKDQIKSQPESFVPENVACPFISGSTGGSTGIPLKYRLSQECYCRGVALLLRGWGFAGYRPGDKVAIIAGASLVSSEETFRKKLQDLLLNFRHYSSYGMNSELLDEYVVQLNKWRPHYLRGYASSLFILAKHLKRGGSDLKFGLKGIFSTAEILSAGQRKVIEEVLGARVFDNYGLNDGGASAFECRAHDGMHIDYERAILETIDDSGKVIAGKTGRIIATSLYNFAMPFIRYDTGDLGVVDRSTCSCGNQRPLLKRIHGRTTDYLKLNGRIIGSPVLTVLMGKIDLENYQIIQKSATEVDVRYIRESVLDSKDENYIRRSFFEHVGPVKMNFRKEEADGLKMSNKHKFIINEVCR
jgi:phenylacetate-CoA ligase